MIKLAIVVLVGSACGNAPRPPLERAAPAPRPVSSVAAPAKPRLRTDCEPTRLGGAATWASAGTANALRFCPGDRELVSAEETVVARYRVEDGARLVTTPVDQVGTTRWSGVIDCRADGVALTLDAERSPILIDATGKVTTPPEPIEASRAWFAADGSVWALTNDDGVVAWNGTKVAPAIAPSAHVLFADLGDGGAYVERIYDSGKISQDGMWMVRDGARIKLPGENSDLVQVSVAPDGSVAVADEMMAYGWIVKGKTAGKSMLLLNQGGTHIKAIAATNRWFMVVDAGGSIWKAMRPKMRWAEIKEPCGPRPNVFMAMAVAHDDKRVAVACSGVGIRIFDIETGKQLSKDAMRSGADTVAWSPNGDELATLAVDGPLQVWRGSNLVTTIAGASGRSLWWASPTEVGGTSYSDLATWTIADGTEHIRKPPITGLIARSPHGELVVARRERDLNQVTILRGDAVKTLDLPKSTADWIDGVAINDRGTRAVLWRGQDNGEPGSEVVEIDLASGETDLYRYPSTAVAIGDDFVIIAVPDGDVDHRAKGVVKTLGNHADVTALAVFHDIVAVGSKDGTINVWTTSGVSLGELTGHTAAIRGLAFTADGKRLASTGSDTTLVWDLSND